MGGNFEPEMAVAGGVRIHRGINCRRMSNVSITVLSEPDLENILAPGERLLWSGCACYGRRFIQTVGAKQMLHIGLLVVGVVLWGAVPFIAGHNEFGLGVGIWVCSAATVLLALISYNAACQRQYVLYNSAYFVSDKRAFVCRYGRNWRLGARAYIVSCPHSQAYPYEVISSRPHPSLQIGTMFSENLVQSSGIGLGHSGQAFLWGRMIVPVVFEYVPNAQELLELIRSCSQDAPAQAGQ